MPYQANKQYLKIDGKQTMFVDQTRKRFGMLKVIGYSHQDVEYGQNSAFWKCKCDCGVICYHSSKKLVDGINKSCGCLAHVVSDISNMVFGYLTAIKYVGSSDKGYNTLWLCQCVCGKNTIVPADKLKSGNTTTCGCGFSKGGNFCWFDYYASKIDFADEVRRSKKNKSILEVKCTYCGKWHMPSKKALRKRITCLHSINRGEGRLYCSLSCKKNCPIYNQKTRHKGSKNQGSREVQPQLRQMRFEIDNWTCQKCGLTENLQCHHIDPVKNNPIESADVDNTITLCVKCHKKVHKIPGCRYYELSCRNEVV